MTETMEQVGSELIEIDVPKPDFDSVHLPGDVWTEALWDLQDLNAQAPDGRFPRIGFEAGSQVEDMEGNKQTTPEDHTFFHEDEEPPRLGPWNVKCGNCILEGVKDFAGNQTATFVIQPFGSEYEQVKIVGVGQTEESEDHDQSIITEMRISLTLVE